MIILFVLVPQITLSDEFTWLIYHYLSFKTSAQIVFLNSGNSIENCDITLNITMHDFLEKITFVFKNNIKLDYVLPAFKFV